MAEEKHHHHLFHHNKDEGKPAKVDYTKEEKHHKHKEHFGELGILGAGGFTLISKDGELQKDKKLLSSVSEDFMVSESMLKYLVESLGFSSYEKPIWVLKQTKQLLMNCVREAVENQQERQRRCCDEEIISEEVLS
ncbi:hypothetical protein QJS10_CPA08g00590 [Acorus calamus]|uniref:Uncharacterized protein n=1 Tax=Acorus calamus TaxID=4465 RepID=A0AAV9EBB1_ACOCL|nr:hypothetical protein QJS10_CPA08g00590 [Acorus calamus]